MVAEQRGSAIGEKPNGWLMSLHPGVIEEESDTEIRVDDKSLNPRFCTFIRLTVGGGLAIN